MITILTFYTVRIILPLCLLLNNPLYQLMILNDKYVSHAAF